MIRRVVTRLVLNNNCKKDKRDKLIISFVIKINRFSIYGVCTISSHVRTRSITKIFVQVWFFFFFFSIRNALSLFFFYPQEHSLLFHFCFESQFLSPNSLLYSHEVCFCECFDCFIRFIILNTFEISGKVKHELRVPIYELRVYIHKIQVQIYKLGD